MPKAYHHDYHKTIPNNQTNDRWLACVVLAIQYNMRSATLQWDFNNDSQPDFRFLLLLNGRKRILCPYTHTHTHIYTTYLIRKLISCRIVGDFLIICNTSPTQARSMAAAGDLTRRLSDTI